MDDETDPGRIMAAPVRLHLHRGIGWGVYGSATVLVGLIGTVGTIAYLRSGRWWMAVLSVLVAVPLTGFLAVLTDAMVRPGLTVTAAGIGGRMPRGHPIDVGWEDVIIDVAEDAAPATLRLDVGTESVSINARAWLGFSDFVRLVHQTPGASARLTPGGRREVSRLLRIDA